MLVFHSCLYLFAQTAGIFEQVVHSVGLLSLLGYMRILPGQCKVRQDVDHNLGETIGQQVSPVLLETSANRLYLLEVIQEDQMGNQHLVGRAIRTQEKDVHSPLPS